MSSPWTLFGESVLAGFGLATLLVSIQFIAFFPLTIAYEIWKRRALRRLSAKPFHGKVSVIVPAFNEESASMRSVAETSKSCATSIPARVKSR